MNLLGIVFLLLISSSSVLCRRIRRQDLEIPPEKELVNPTELTDENPERIQNAGWNLEVTTPAEDIPQENSAIPDQTETEGGGLPEYQGKLDSPMSKKRIQKMLQKAIVQIITGDLTTADMALLKSLNVDAEEVRTIREQELKKKKNLHPKTMTENRRPGNRMDHDNEKSKKDASWERHAPRKSGYDYEAYNNQATFDYENAASNFEANNESWNDSLPEYEDRTKSSTETLPDNGGLMKPNIVFTISYNDPEFDSSSEENPKLSSAGDNSSLAINGTGNTFPGVTTSANSSPAPVDDEIDTRSEVWRVPNSYFSTTEDPVEDNDVGSQNIPSRKQNEDLDGSSTNSEDQLNRESRFRYNIEEPLTGEENRSKVSPGVAALPSTTENPSASNDSTTSENRTLSTRYKGLKWIQDNVYQVIPEYIDFMPSENTENDTSDSSYDDASYQNLDDVAAKNLTTPNELVDADGMANDAPDPSRAGVSAEDLANLTAHQIAATHRQVLKQKTENDIKSKVLSFTGRLNTTGNNNPLAMFSPTCETPRNTDNDLWQDSFSMNMHFRLNLTSDQHLAAARLRLYRLPQENATATASTIVDGVESDEKKIRISVYYYTKSLKKHRTAKKCLMDSKVVSLRATGEHFALDVKDAAKRWRSTNRNTNHGLLVLVEDQEGHHLRPSHYIQAPNCHNPTDSSVQQDEKAYQRVPELFVRACRRYVRFVGDTEDTLEICG